MIYSIIDQIPAGFRAAVHGWETGFATIGLHLLYLLALLGFAWEVIVLALQRTPLEGYLPMLVRQAIMVGLFVWFIDNSQWIAMSVIDSFRLAGTQVTGLPSQIYPSTMLDNGVSLFRAIKSTASIFNLDEALAILFMAVVILACFAWIAVLYILALVEMYLVVATIPLFVAWGGTTWTRGVALNALRYPVAAGAKLLTLMLLAGVLNRLVTDWVTAFEAANKANDIDVLFGFSLVAAALTHSIPALVAGMINGSASTAGHGLMTAVSNFRTGAGMAGKGIAAASGAGALVGAAGGLALAQRAASGAEPASGALGKLGSGAKLALETMNNSFAGVGAAQTDKMSGRVSSHASSTWAAAAGMRDTTRHLRSEAGRPKPSPEEVSNTLD
ncbi:MAG: P-type conjugative transfer protein TrbL [Rhodospirillales bacterium]|nr:P-type conjugative transfer protein TrbL [Rhodospirillales bacterium]